MIFNVPSNPKHSAMLHIMILLSGSGHRAYAMETSSKWRGKSKKSKSTLTIWEMAFRALKQREDVPVPSEFVTFHAAAG